MSKTLYLKKSHIILLSLISLLSKIVSELSIPSYIKIYKNEAAILKDLNKDILDVDIENLVNNIVYPGVTNFTSPLFPGIFIDLFDIKAEGNEFSINNAYVLNTNTSTIATDPSNSSYIFFSGNYAYRNGTIDNKGTFSVRISSSEFIYIKEYQNIENTFQIKGKINIIWDDGEFTFEKDTQGKDAISKAFMENFNSKCKDLIDKDLNSKLSEYLSKLTFDSKKYFNLTSQFSSKNIPSQMIDLKLLNVDSTILTSKFDTLLNFHYSGYFESFSNISKPAESQFDIRKMDLSKLYKGVFIDKFLFESLLNQQVFKGFFLRNEVKNENIPEALDFDLDIKDLSRIIPEIKNIYSVLNQIKVNYAIYNPQIIFEDDKFPIVKSKFDFTIYIKDSNKNFKQIFTSSCDLIFELTYTNIRKNTELNFDIKLLNIDNFLSSNNFSVVNTDYLGSLIRELINYGIEKNKIEVFENDLNLSNIFEEDFSAKYFKGGILLYHNLN